MERSISTLCFLGKYNKREGEPLVINKNDRIAGSAREQSEKPLKRVTKVADRQPGFSLLPFPLP